MYLHLGENTVINSEDMIGIFDMEKTSVSKDTKDFLRNRFGDMEIITVSYDMPSSYIITQTKAQKPRVYISPISAATLRKRSGSAI